MNIKRFINGGTFKWTKSVDLHSKCGCCKRRIAYQAQCAVRFSNLPNENGFDRNPVFLFVFFSYEKVTSNGIITSYSQMINLPQSFTFTPMNICD